MMAYCQEVSKLEDKFDSLEFAHVLRGRNEAADELAKLGSSRATVPPSVFLQELHKSTIRKKPVKATTASKDARGIENGNDPKSTEVMVIHSDWRTPFIDYLANKVLPDDKAEAKRLKRRALFYQLVDGELYRRRPQAYI